MLKVERQVNEVSGFRFDNLPEDLLASTIPVLCKGLVSDWPVVRAARKSDAALDEYLRQFYQGATVGVFFSEPESGGRVFYNEDMTGFNFQRAMVKLGEVLDKIQQHSDDEHPPAYYVGSTTVDTCLPGFRSENDVDLGDRNSLASLWLGNRTRVAAHYDVPDNLACCAAGRRRFILFPPEQLENLYVGPLDFSPAGQAISLVDFSEPDFERFPRFSEALKHARVAEMEPGDAIFIPGMWWHHVEGLNKLNLLINYWWRNTPAFMGRPVNALEHAMLSIRDLPANQRQAWKEIFMYYIFEFDESKVEHIPEHIRGVLSTMDDVAARKLRAQLLNKLNR